MKSSTSARSTSSGCGELFGPQLVGEGVIEPAHLDLINSHIPSAVIGVLLASFTGRWISDPGATRIAENKLLQLEVARRAGLPTPRTIVSTDPDTIRRFCSAVGDVVVKGLRQSTTAVLMTQRVRPEHLESAEAIRMCPAYDLDEEVVARLRRVLDELNLRMGIFDLKLNGSTPTWLELNPQGQFLFAEGMSGIPLNFEIGRFLRAESLAVDRRRAIC
jgi:hypothetical protein